MHVNDLPYDVLILVFRATLPAIKRQPADVGSWPGLLSVCRRWQEVALPMVYNTVVVSCGTKGADELETVYIMTKLDLVVDAKCLHVVRKVVINVRYQASPLQGLKAAIERMRGAACEWAGVRKLELGLNVWGWEESELSLPAADNEDEIASVSSALAALMPGLREIDFYDFQRAPIARVLIGQLVGFYADQLQVLHSSNQIVVPQDRVFARLRDVKIRVCFSQSLEGKLPRLDPEVVESLVLSGFTANNMLSMFCADSGGCAIAFPRLTNLDLEYRPRYMMDSEQLSNKRPWALQFPAVKRVKFSCFDERCPSMENAVFPDHLESLDIFGSLNMLSVFAGRKVHVSRNLTISVAPESDVNNRGIATANHILEAADSCCSRNLVIRYMDAIPLEHITYTRLTHLQSFVSTGVDDIIQIINRQRHLVSLQVHCLNPADAQTDFSIPECAEHEPMAPLDTQIRSLEIWRIEQEELTELGFRVLKYLLLRIPTLKYVGTQLVPREQIQAFIDEYVRWYPHLANVKFVR